MIASFASFENFENFANFANFASFENKNDRLKTCHPDKKDRLKTCHPVSAYFLYFPILKFSGRNGFYLLCRLHMGVLIYYKPLITDCFNTA